MGPKRLVLFVEGFGELDGGVALVKRLLTEKQAWDVFYLDEDAFRTGGLDRLVTKRAVDQRNWEDWLLQAAKRGALGGVLLIADGDKALPFCAGRTALSLAVRAAAAGAGRLFSVAVVIAQQEFETWLVAGVESLAGKPLAGGHPGILPGAKPPSGLLEQHPRDAKGWLSSQMPASWPYKPTQHQAQLAQMVNLELIRNAHLRSFRRLDQSLDKLIHAVRNNRPIALPAPQP